MKRRFVPVHRLSALTGIMAAAVLTALFLAPAADAEPQLRTSLRVSGTSFLRAFREVVVEPRSWTVRLQRRHPRTGRWQDAAFGVVVRSDGLILSKASELDGELRARLNVSGDTPARVVARDEANDLALVKVDETDLPVVKWSREDPDVGRWAVVPDIYRSPVAAGIVSVPRRSIPKTDSPGMLGVRLSAVVDEDGNRRPGAFVVAVTKDSAAERAGLVEGDIITAVDGRLMYGHGAVIQEMARRRPGDRVTLTLRREGESVRIDARLTQPSGAFFDQRPELRFGMMNELGGRLSERRSDFPAAIQHDAVLVPSECGGASVNLDGECIGINIARAGRTESLMIPPAEARRIAERLMSEL